MRASQICSWTGVAILVVGTSLGCKSSAPKCDSCHGGTPVQIIDVPCSGCGPVESPCTDCAPTPCDGCTPTPVPAADPTPGHESAPNQADEAEPTEAGPPTELPAPPASFELPAADLGISTSDSISITVPNVVSDTVELNDSPQMLNRRDFADITADPRFSHAEDYSWLVGELNYLHSRRGWRLRYASINEEDPYGGSVSLNVSGHMLANLRDGQIVRVHGMLLDPESRKPAPEYRVVSITALN